MCFLTGQSSLWDERYWRLDSRFLSSSHPMDIGALSYEASDGRASSAANVHLQLHVVPLVGSAHIPCPL